MAESKDKKPRKEEPCDKCRGWGRRAVPIKEWGETIFVNCEACLGIGRVPSN